MAAMREDFPDATGPAMAVNEPSLISISMSDNTAEHELVFPVVVAGGNGGVGTAVIAVVVLGVEVVGDDVEATGVAAADGDSCTSHVKELREIQMADCLAVESPIVVSVASPVASADTFNTLLVTQTQQ